MAGRHTHLRGLATAIHEISGLGTSRLQQKSGKRPQTSYRTRRSRDPVSIKVLFFLDSGQSFRDFRNDCLGDLWNSFLRGEAETVILRRKSYNRIFEFEISLVDNLSNRSEIILKYCNDSIIGQEDRV